jgi:hypothetical protein
MPDLLDDASDEAIVVSTERWESQSKERERSFRSKNWLSQKDARATNAKFSALTAWTHSYSMPKIAHLYPKQMKSTLDDRLHHLPLELSELPLLSTFSLLCFFFHSFPLQFLCFILSSLFFCGFFCFFSPTSPVI